jgi:chromosomal replication initiator protein
LRLEESPAVDASAIPGRVAEALRRRIGDERFELWFAGKTRFTLAGNTLVVEAAHGFAVRWIAGKFREDLAACAAACIGRAVAVELRVNEELGVSPARPGIAPSPVMRPHPAPVPVAPSVLNPHHTLENFVLGPSNQMAYHAAQRVAEQPARLFNPLFIHGHCGLGKTHLLQGICHRFAKMHPGRKWLYLTGEQFTNDYLEAIRLHKTEAFRRRIRGAQLLVIDDIHFLANKRATQEEFLHTFNHIDAGGCQIVLASDCAPRQIQALSDPLASRFVSGMVLRVDSPDLPTRLEILRRKVARQGWNISDAILMHIARSDVSSVREMEGMLLQVVAGIRLIDAGQDAGAVLAHLRERSAVRGPVPVDRILEAVAVHFAVGSDAIRGSARGKIIHTARAVAMHLARQHSGMSYPEIGRAFGGKNHSTVIGACQRVEAMLTGGTLLCWSTPEGPRHQSIADALHELEAAIRRTR